MSPWALWPCGHTVDTRAEVAEHRCAKWNPNACECPSRGESPHALDCPENKDES